MVSFAVNAVAPVAEPQMQQPAVHWKEQTASQGDKAQMASAMRASQPSAGAAPATQAAASLPASSAASPDMLGRARLFAALEGLRTTPAERMPVAAAELMVQCFEYQFNVTAVTHAAKNVEEGVQTMTTRT